MVEKTIHTERRIWSGWSVIRRIFKEVQAAHCRDR